MRLQIPDSIKFLYKDGWSYLLYTTDGKRKAIKVLEDVRKMVEAT